MDDLNPSDGGKTVAIVGGGFSGTMTAVHLARLAGTSPVRILLLEKADRFARGVAYGTRSDHHLLNVGAGHMSALADEPAHFLDWLRARDPAAHAGTFALRKVYGEYLEDLLRATSRGQNARIELIRDEVMDLAVEGAGTVHLTTAGGTTWAADHAVLALGHPLPQSPAGLDRAGLGRGFVANPWAPGALEELGEDDPIALIGSGLTAADLVVEARAAGHRGTISCISRHGMLPRAHRPSPPRPHFSLAGGPSTARGLLRRVRSEVAECQEEGGDWRSVVDAIRPSAQAVWRSLCDAERSRFLRHLAPHWDAHRHRVAPEIDDVLCGARREGRLRVVAGRVLSIAARGDDLALSLRHRASDEVETLVARRVINCTGPGRDLRLTRSALLTALIDRGIGRPGRLALGLDVDDSGALIGRDGQPQARVSALGPLLKEHLWETTAVRELRAQAMDQARRILGRPAR